MDFNRRLRRSEAGLNGLRDPQIASVKGNRFGRLIGLVRRQCSQQKS